MSNFITQQAAIEDHLNLLTLENIDTVIHAMIHALAVWMDEHDKATVGGINKDNVMGRFEALATCVVEGVYYQRIAFPSERAVPQFSSEKVDEISEKIIAHLRHLDFDAALHFLGELTRAWILTCPAEIIQDETAKAGDTNPFGYEGETYLRWSLEKWLHTYLYG